jgi:hypothetical protein
MADPLCGAIAVVAISYFIVVGLMALDTSSSKRLVRRLAWRRQEQRLLAGLEVTDDEALTVICFCNDPIVPARRGVISLSTFNS